MKFKDKTYFDSRQVKFRRSLNIFRSGLQSLEGDEGFVLSSSQSFLKILFPKYIAQFPAIQTIYFTKR